MLRNAGLFVCPQSDRNLSVLEAFHDLKPKLAVSGFHGDNQPCSLVHLVVQKQKNLLSHGAKFSDMEAKSSEPWCPSG